MRSLVSDLNNVSTVERRLWRIIQSVDERDAGVGRCRKYLGGACKEVFIEKELDSIKMEFHVRCLHHNGEERCPLLCQIFCGSGWS